LLSQPYAPAGCTGSMTCYGFVLVRYRPGADLAAARRQLQSALTAHGCPPGCASISTDQQPADIRDYAQVIATPAALSGLLALLAVAALAHVLLTGVRRRRRDLAVLKILGMRRAQLLQVVSWQASAMAGAALLVGIPVGLAAGRWAWAVFAASAGVSPTPVVPVLAVALAVPATLVLAIAIAAAPGWEAARIQPAVILRRD
jgi:predicted lysophospholipase L1 biosynthesis ABC-type transport system permease subunit